MSWTLISYSHTSDTGITPPSQSGREEIASTRATLSWEMRYFVSRVAWAAVPMPVWNSDRLWSDSCWQHQDDVIWWCRRPESKGCRVDREVVNQFVCWNLGSQRHWGKKNPNLAPQFMRPNARSKLQFTSIRKSNDQVEKPRRDWRCNGIRVIQGCVQFWCLNGISEDGIQGLLEVSTSLI